jgi:hypothetical protein
LNGHDSIEIKIWVLAFDSPVPPSLIERLPLAIGPFPFAQFCVDPRRCRTSNGGLQLTSLLQRNSHASKTNVHIKAHLYSLQRYDNALFVLQRCSLCAGNEGASRAHCSIGTGDPEEIEASSPSALFPTGSPVSR